MPETTFLLSLHDVMFTALYLLHAWMDFATLVRSVTQNKNELIRSWGGNSA